MASFDPTDEPLPPQRLPDTIARVRILEVAEGDSYIVRLLSDKYQGVMCHFFGGKVQYCRGDGDCIAAMHRTPRSWKGYAAAQVFLAKVKPYRWRYCVLELTENAELDCRGVFARGQVWNIWRPPPIAKKKREPVQMKLLEEHDPETFPAEFDIVPILKIRYHVENWRWFGPNPQPPRVYLDDTEGPVPDCLKAALEPQDEPGSDGKPYMSFQERAQRAAAERRKGPADKMGK